jgi:hypothetical protein
MFGAKPISALILVYFCNLNVVGSAWHDYTDRSCLDLARGLPCWSLVMFAPGWSDPNRALGYFTDNDMIREEK